MRSVTDFLLEALNSELALSNGAITNGVKVAHNALHDALRRKEKKGPNYLHPAPDWDRFPVGRSFFTQHFS